MTGMKRWFAGLLAGLVLFSGIAFSESTGRDTVQIQESLVSREGETTHSLEDTLRMLIRLTQKDEVKNLLQIEDVSDIFTDVILKVLTWMDNNRPVSDKILTEMGINEEDLRCINKFWDSADRIVEASQSFQDSEKGKQLQQEFSDLIADPDFRQSLTNFQTLMTTDTVRKILESIRNTVESGTEAALGEGELTDEALERHLDRASFTGSLLIILLDIIQNSAWGSESVPKLLNNEALWTLLTDLANTDTDLDEMIREEFQTLTSDPDVTAFVQRAAEAVSNVINEYKNLSGSLTDAGENPQEETEDTGNE